MKRYKKNPNSAESGNFDGIGYNIEELSSELGSFEITDADTAALDELLKIDLPALDLALPPLDLEGLDLDIDADALGFDVDMSSLDFGISPEELEALNSALNLSSEELSSL